MIQNSICFIIACYNDEDVIGTTLDSVLQNLQSDDRIFIVDGASTDNSVKVIQRYAEIDQRIKFQSEPDTGIYNAWNKAIRKCENEWVSFVGCGDLLRSDFREKMLSSTRAGTNVNFIHCHARQIITLQKEYLLLGRLGAPFNPEQFTYRMKVSQCGALHHLRLFEDGMFNEEYRCNSDYLFLLERRNDLKTRFVDEELVYMDSGGISSSSLLLFTEELKMKSDMGHPNMWRTYLMMIPRVLKRVYLVNWRKIKANLKLGTSFSLNELLTLRA